MKMKMISFLITLFLVTTAHGAKGPYDKWVENMLVEPGLMNLSSARILVGDANGKAADVAVSGDVTISNAGAVTIAAAAVDESMLADATSDALNVRRIARATYDFAVDGGAISTIGSGVTLPDNAIITKCWFDVSTTLTSATDAATIAIISLPMVTYMRLSPFLKGLIHGMQEFRIVIRKGMTMILKVPI